VEVGADLDQVAHLVGLPQRPTTRPLRLCRPPPGERVVDAAGVAHLAHDGLGLPPQPDGPRTGAVSQTARRQALDGERELLGQVVLYTGAHRVRHDEVPEGGQPGTAERQVHGRYGRLREGTTEDGLRKVRAAVGRAGPTGAVLQQERMTGSDLLQDRRSEPHRVVGATQPQRCGRRQGHVQQRLVQVALGDLHRAAAGPDGFP
jgi:hypothetical protein